MMISDAKGVADAKILRRFGNGFIHGRGLTKRQRFTYSTSAPSGPR